MFLVGSKRKFLIGNKSGEIEEKRVTGGKRGKTSASGKRSSAGKHVAGKKFGRA